MLLWYDEETGKEYPVFQLKNPQDVANLNFKWIGQTREDDFGRSIMLWMGEENVYFTIHSMM